MTMKIAITNLANRTGDVLVMSSKTSGTCSPRRLKRGETVTLVGQETVGVTLRPEHADAEDEYVGTPNLIVSDPPCHL